MINHGRITGRREKGRRLAIAGIVSGFIGALLVGTLFLLAFGATRPRQQLVRNRRETSRHAKHQVKHRRDMGHQCQPYSSKQNADRR